MNNATLRRMYMHEHIVPLLVALYALLFPYRKSHFYILSNKSTILRKVQNYSNCIPLLSNAITSEHANQS